MNATDGTTFPRRVGLALIAMALVVLVLGWWVGVDAFRRVVPGAVSMKANTAVGFALLGTGLRWPAVRTLAAAALLALGAITFAQDVFAFNLGIDQLLVTDPGDRGTGTLGRMAPNTALSFVSLGLAMLAARFGRLRVAAPWVGIGAINLSMIAIAGYVLGVQDLYGFGTFTQMAIHTSVAMFVGALAMMWTVRDVSPIRLIDGHGTATKVLRIDLTLGFFAPLVAGWLARQGVFLDLYSLDLSATMHVMFAQVMHVLLALHLGWYVYRAEKQVMDAEAYAVRVRKDADHQLAQLQTFIERRERLDRLAVVENLGNGGD